MIRQLLIFVLFLVNIDKKTPKLKIKEPKQKLGPRETGTGPKRWTKRLRVARFWREEKGEGRDENYYRVGRELLKGRTKTFKGWDSKC